MPAPAVPRLDRNELAGGLGDAGLFIPIAVALVAVNGLAATAVFGVAGATYLATAVAFRVPVPVQPLKAFAAAAIALKLDADVIAAGALLMAAAMTLLAATGLAAWLAERFPVVLVRGIQASVALLLAKAAVELAEQGNWQGFPGVSAAAGLAMAAVACAALLLLGRARLPGTLLVLAAGAAGGIALAGLPPLNLGPELSAAPTVPDGRRSPQPSHHWRSPSFLSPLATRWWPRSTPSAATSATEPTEFAPTAWPRRSREPTWRRVWRTGCPSATAQGA